MCNFFSLINLIYYYDENVEEVKSIQKNKNKQPSNLEAEQALLGSIMVNNDIIDEISTLISPIIFLTLRILKFMK